MTSGLILGSSFGSLTGPRELKLAILLLCTALAPTAKLASVTAGGSWIVEHPFLPEFPAETDINMPAATTFSMVCRSTLRSVHPSEMGQP